jgi:hypothetical protein
MSKVTAFKIDAGGIHYVTISGSKKIPKLETNESIRLPGTRTMGDLLEWYHTQFDLVLNRERSDLVCYKLTSGLKKHTQIFNIYFGLSLLCLISHRKGILSKHVTPSSLRPKSFGLPRDGSIDAMMDGLFSAQSPWNKNMREVAAIAYLNL